MVDVLVISWNYPKIYQLNTATNLIYLLNMCPRNLNRAILLRWYELRSCEVFDWWVGLFRESKIGFIRKPHALGWLEEWALLGQSVEMPTYGLSRLVFSAQSDFLNGSSGFPASQKVEAAILLSPVPRNCQSVTSAIFYQSKQSQHPFRFKERGHRLYLLMWRELKSLYSYLIH